MTGRDHTVLTEELVMGISSWFGARGSARRQNWLRRLVIPSTGQDDPQIDEMKKVAAADVAELEEDDRSSDPDGPGRDPDEL
jgi:hypothetical protein